MSLICVSIFIDAPGDVAAAIARAEKAVADGASTWEEELATSSWAPPPGIKSPVPISR